MDVLSTLRRVAATVCLVAAVTGAARAQEPPEHDVKAEFLYNFTRFVEWPGEVPRAGEPFRLCVVADTTMRRAIERMVTEELVNGRPLVVMRPRRLQDARQCQILFVGRSEQQRASRLLAAVRDLPVLTVGESARFAEQGGVIEFVTLENRVRFDVNLPGAQRSKLKVSSNLLRVARQVVGAPR